MIRTHGLSLVLALVTALSLSITPALSFAQDSSDVVLPPGTVTRTEPAETPNAYRLWFTSTAETGQSVPVSALVLESALPWTGPGPRPTVVIGPGTRGQADICAPSKSIFLLGNVDPAHGAVNINYEMPLYYAFSMQGVRVVVSDYVGLGTEGVHTYVNTIEEGHALLDAARAALTTSTGTVEGNPVAFYGYSQGGGAAASAAEQAAQYAPELEVKGTYAGGIPVDLLETIDYIDRPHPLFSAVGYAINGIIERHPEVAHYITDELTDEGLRFLEETKNSCTVDGLVRWGGRDSTSITRSGQRITDLVRANPELSALLDKQRLGRHAVNAPIMINNARNDGTIPFEPSHELAQTYCAQGAIVTELVDETPALPNALLNHGVALAANSPASVTYVMDRFRNIPATSTCA